MSPQVYTSDELLGLRARKTDGIMRHDLAKVSKEAEIPGILRSPPASEPNAAIQGCRKSEVASSAEMREYELQPTEVDETREYASHAAETAETAEWQYRGRSAQEATVTEPLPAPPTLSAQKNEGFQRFYKAVVSPTHVRVTAGGRIVPNTRGPPSPTSKVNKERELHEMQQNTRSGPYVPQNMVSVHQALSPMAPQPVYPLGFSTAMIQPQLPYAAHLPFGFNLAGGFALPHFAGSKYGIPQTTQAAPTADIQSNAGTLNGQTADSSRASRPTVLDQFEQTRPYLVNGQFVLPLGSPAYPYYMPGMFPTAPSLLGSPFSGALLTPQTHQPVPAAPTTVGFNTTHFGSSAHQMPEVSNPVLQAVNAPNTPPISSIRPSQITKSHIESLRSNLKRVEDQLQYNVHQIDVKYMETLAKEIRESIRGLEDALPRQLDFEQLHYSAGGNDTKLNTEFFAFPSLRKDEANMPGRSRKDQQRAGLVNSSNGTDQVTTVRLDEASSNSMESEPSKQHAGLPVSAAAAPPFQPRADTSVGQLFRKDGGSSSSDNVISQPISSLSHKDVREAMREAVKKRLMASGGDSFNAMARAMVGKGSAMNAQTIGKTNGNAHSKGASEGNNKTTTVPYLVGQLPPGVKEENATDYDLVYPRQLTEEEIRARHLFWGRAPQSAMVGLPKFDGKNFYPPSPVKVNDHHICTASDDALQRGYGFHFPSTDSDPFSSGATKMMPLNTSSSSGKCDSEDDSAEVSGASRSRRSTDRSSIRRANDLWLSMHRNGHAGGVALPGEVTSTTAQGCLPQYAGHAAASLSPAIANASLSPRGPLSKPTGECPSSPGEMLGEEARSRNGIALEQARTFRL